MHIHAATSEATIGISPATASQLYTFPVLLPRKDSAFVSRNPANTRTKPAIAISLPSTASTTSLSTIGRRLYHRAYERGMPVRRKFDLEKIRAVTNGDV